LQIGNFDILWN